MEMDPLYSALEFLQSNAWFILIACLGLYYLFNKYNLNLPDLRRPTHVQQHRDVDERQSLQRMENIEAVRIRQQAAMDALAVKHREKKSEAATKGKEERVLSEAEEMAKLGLTKKNMNETKKGRVTRNDDYNPMTGQSSNTQDRPNFRRSQPSRGG